MREESEGTSACVRPHVLVPVGSAFPPETGDESPHSGRASGARGTGPPGAPRAVHLLFPSLGHILPRTGCLPPLAPASTSAVGGTDRATESGRGRGRNFADLQRGGHPERAAAAGLAGVEGSDSGRGVGRGWAELRGCAVVAVGPQTRRGHQLWTWRVGPRAQYRAAAGLGGLGRGSAGPWATGCWGPLVTSAGRGRCPRSLSKVPKLETSLPRFPAPVAEATGLCGWCPRGPRGRSHGKRGPGSSLAAGLGDPFSHSSAVCLSACPSARPSIHPSVPLSVFEDDPPTLLRPAL